MGFTFGKRRAVFVNIKEELEKSGNPLTQDDATCFENLDLIYRTMCALLFNYVPTSGHPGGSISAGRIISGLIFDTMNYDVSDPNREDADIISFCSRSKYWASISCGHCEMK